MAFCMKCGTQLADGVKFCASCGTPAGGAESKAAAKNENTAGKPPVINTADAKEKLKMGREKARAGINKLPFRRLAEDKISAGAKAKVPLLNKAIPFANYIVCGLAVLLVVIIIIAASGGNGPKALARQAYNITQKALREGIDPEKSPALSRKSLAIGKKVLKLSASNQIVYAEELARLIAGTVVSAGSGGVMVAQTDLKTIKMNAASDFIYKLNEEGTGVIITGFHPPAALSKANVIIPSKIEGYPVVEFSPSDDLFDPDNLVNPLLISVVFPDSVTKIGEWAFFGCAYLESITLPKNLKEIPRGFASECKSLTTVKWPGNLEIIGNFSFDGTALTKLVIPAGVKEIRDGAFLDINKLTSLTIPGSVEYIGESAFAKNSNLTEVKISSKAIKYQSYNSQSKSWGDVSPKNLAAFEGCTRLNIATQKTIKDTGYTGSFE